MSSEFIGELPLGARKPTLQSRISGPRPLNEIADEISEAYDTIGVDAAECVSDLQTLEGVEDKTTDGRNGRQVVRQFLELSRPWGYTSTGALLRAELQRHLR